MSAPCDEFIFLDPGHLVDEDLELVLTETDPGDAARGLIPQYSFVMRVAGCAEEAGCVSLRVGLTEKLKQFGGNLGYGVHENLRGHRYAARACMLLFPLARRHGLTTLWVTCGVDNKGSRRTCEIMGGQYVDTIDAEIEPGKFRPTCRYRVDMGNAETFP